MLGQAGPARGISPRGSFQSCLSLRPQPVSRRQTHDLTRQKRRAAQRAAAQQVGSTPAVDIAQEFVHSWWQFLSSKSVRDRQQLQRLCAPNVRTVPDSALIPQTADIQGVEDLLHHLSAQHASYSKESHNIRAVASSDGNDSAGTTVFVLVDFALKDTAATPQHPATFRVSQGFGIFRLEVEGNVVQHVELKRQLTHEEVDGILLDSIHVYPAPFPLHELQLGQERQGQQDQGVQGQQRDEGHKAAAAVVKQWVDAHAAEADLSALDSLLSQDSRLFEAYGILLPTFPALPSPPHCTIEGQPSALSTSLPSNPEAHHFSVRSALGQLHNRSRFIPASQVRFLLQVLQSSYSVLELQGVAIAVDAPANLAFASWSSTVQNRCSGQTFKVREMHAITLAPPDSHASQWKLRSIWALRDPYDFERAMLLRPKRQQAETGNPPGGTDLYADLVAGLPNPQDIFSAVQNKVNPQDILSAVQNKVGSVDALPWGAIAQSLGEIASAFSAASAAAAARAQGSASKPADAAPGKERDSAAAASKEDSAADAVIGAGAERPGGRRRP